MIPKEALEKAAKAGIAAWNRAEPDRQAGASYIASHVDSIRVALEAAAPFIRAQALTDAADEGWKAMLVFASRKQMIPGADDFRDWLRARAATERGQG